MGNNGWIIDSLLDVDFYKLTMAQLAFLEFPDVPVKFEFKNRTAKICLSDFINEEELRGELDHVRRIKGISEREENYLRSLGFFQESFIGFLKNLSLPEYSLERNEQGYAVSFEGRWPEVTFWETICLSIVSELYYRSLMVNMIQMDRKGIYAEGRRRLDEKIRVLKANPDIRFIEFGTRRRFSWAWQQFVIDKLEQEVPSQLLGTSNVAFAMKRGMRPIGTFAHEMFMVFSGIFRNDLLGSHNKVLEYWRALYGDNLSIALTDTYGTDFFFRDMTRRQAEEWKGLRQDSGDPFEFGEKSIRFYESLEIDPRSKLIVFSDGLDVEKIVRLQNRFQDRIGLSFGWGTNLTNDLGFGSLSLVAKAVRSNGYGTVKFSDNLAKATGRAEDIQLFKEVFGYSSVFREECVY